MRTATGFVGSTLPIEQNPPSRHPSQDDLTSDWEQSRIRGTSIHRVSQEGLQFRPQVREAGEEGGRVRGTPRLEGLEVPGHRLTHSLLVIGARFITLWHVAFPPQGGPKSLPHDPRRQPTADRARGGSRFGESVLAPGTAIVEWAKS